MGCVKSIVTEEETCFVCGNPNVHIHHIFYGTANHKKADKHRLTIPLCQYHHQDSKEGVHFNKTLDTRLKKLAQEKFEEKYGHAMFMQEFGRNYL